MKTEDQVRDDAHKILGLEDTETSKAGVGQLTSFAKLGFKGEGSNYRPDGWYLPNETTFPAIILEVKKEDCDLKQPQIDELLKNCVVAHSKYKNVVGILYNGLDILVYKNEELLADEKELQNKEHYLGLFAQNTIDKQKIYTLTKRINDSLHTNFGIKNLNHRMIFTACALVAKRYGATLVKGMDYTTFHTSIHSTLSKSLEEAKRQNQKLDLLLDVYASIKMNITDNQQAIDEFIDCVTEISDNINSDFWQGEDVMAIFFNEFNRYKGKSDKGQVFTPDHITSLMYNIIHVDKNDIVLDAACGSGAFLVKAMCNMIKDAGGSNTNKAKVIKQKQLYGIEVDREIFALACANMLIHKDGKTNIAQLDSRYEEAGRWIASKGITKVLMNPPFESKYGCLEIVGNVLDNVPQNTSCAFILPDKKLEKDRLGKKLLKKHTLLKIIKLPEKVFTGTTTSVFIFQAQKPQNDKEIFACYIEDDGLETVKNQGRQDIRNKWNDIEKYWLNVVEKQSGNDTIQWLKPSEHLSYQMPEKPFEIYEEDFVKTMMDYEMFKQGKDVKEFNEQLLQHVLYRSAVSLMEDKVTIILD
ncbi:MAG: SAM-dependent DNA methyltransferase [Paludibacteraceae bacterium]|nr:SAM-dependent DNA methyltransferase [Paludibacteraceae bacterium]